MFNGDHDPGWADAAMRHLITNEIRAVLGPMVESCRSKLGPEPEPLDRMFFQAVLY